MANCKVIKVVMVDGVVNSTTIGYIEERDKSYFESLHPFNKDNFLAGNEECYLLDTNNKEEGLSLIKDLENPEA